MHSTLQRYSIKFFREAISNAPRKTRITWIVHHLKSFERFKKNAVRRLRWRLSTVITAMTFKVFYVLPNAPSPRPYICGARTLISSQLTFARATTISAYGWVRRIINILRAMKLKLQRNSQHCIWNVKRRPTAKCSHQSIPFEKLRIPYG